MSESNDTVTVFSGTVSLDEAIQHTLQSIIVAALTGAEAVIQVDRPETREGLQAVVDEAVAEGVIDEGQVSVELIP